MQYTLIFLATYLFSSIPWGLLIAKMKGVNIREEGSGNIGATNVSRVLGKRWGVLCFFFDFLKGLLPVLIVKQLQRSGVIDPSASFATVLAAFSAVAGHNWSLYLKFKGGKGIATSAGAILAMAPLSLVCAGVLWFIVFKSTRYVSLASICAAIVLPVSAVLFQVFKIYISPKPVIGLLTLLAVLAVIRHRANIKRLLNGTENRFVKKDKDKNENSGSQ